MMMKSMKDDQKGQDIRSQLEALTIAVENACGLGRSSSDGKLCLQVPDTLGSSNSRQPSHMASSQMASSQKPSPRSTPPAAASGNKRASNLGSGSLKSETQILTEALGGSRPNSKASVRADSVPAPERADSSGSLARTTPSPTQQQRVVNFPNVSQRASAQTPTGSGAGQQNL